MAVNPIKSLAGQTAVYGMGTIIPRLLNYFLVPFYTRIFDQDAYGQITELYAYVAFLMVLLTFGMETSFFRYAQKHDQYKVFNNALSSVIVVVVAFLVLLFTLYEPIARLIQYAGNPEYILFIGVIVALDALTAIPFAMLRKLNKARLFATIKLANVALNIGLNLLFIIILPEFSTKLSVAVFGPSSSLVVWVFLSNVFSSLLSLLMLWPLYVKFKWEVSRNLLRSMVAYALPVLIVGLAGMINDVSDKILLKYLLPDASTAMAKLGIYGANYKLGILMTLFIQMFRYASEPFFFAEAEKKNSAELFARVMNYFVVFGLIIFLMVVLYIDVFQYFIGAKYREGLGIVPIILMANLFYGVFYNLSIWYKLTDRTRYGAVISIGGAVITVILNVVLIPISGYYGASWAHFFCYLSMMIVSYTWGQKVYPIPYQLKHIAMYTILAGSIYFVSVLISPWGIVLKIALNTVMFIGFLAFAVIDERKYRPSAQA